MEVGENGLSRLLGAIGFGRKGSHRDEDISEITNKGSQKIENQPLSPFDQTTTVFERDLDAAMTNTELPNTSKLIVLARSTIAQDDFDTKGDKEESFDLRYQRLKFLFEKYERKRREMDKPDYHYECGLLEELLTAKRRVESIMQPGKFFAHAGYSDSEENINSFDYVLSAGGLMSSAARVRSGLITSRQVPRWGRISKGDSNAISFYPWEDEHAGVYQGSVLNPFDSRGATDMVYIYPAESIAKHAKAIRFLPYYKDDVAVTSSKASIEIGDLTASGDDDTFLPLEEAYIIIPNDKKDQMKTKLRSHGYTDQWIASHVYGINIQWLPREPYKAWQENDISDVLKREKDAINQWLAKQHPQTDNKIKIKGIRNQSPGSSGFNFETLYAISITK